MKLEKAIQPTLVMLAAAATVGVAALGWIVRAPRRVPEGQSPLSVLEASSLPAFRGAFNGSGGEVRVLALLSPT